MQLSWYSTTSYVRQCHGYRSLQLCGTTHIVHVRALIHCGLAALNICIMCACFVCTGCGLNAYMSNGVCACWDPNILQPDGINCCRPNAEVAGAQCACKPGFIWSATRQACEPTGELVFKHVSCDSMCPMPSPMDRMHSPCIADMCVHLLCRMWPEWVPF